jgi:glyceraldehyde-3-phosphate dehydrogenase (ferredoxin)
MGGAAFVFAKLGINYVSIQNKAKTYSILKIKRENNEVKAEFEPIEHLEDIWKDYYGEIGVYALQKFLFDKYKDEFPENKFRMLVTGPAALKTNGGAIASAPVMQNQLTSVDCWAGRGGIGSALLQDHNICAIVYGGDYEVEQDSKFKDRKAIDDIFKENFEGKNMAQVDGAGTTKYRYNEELQTGGTLGVNYTTLKGWMFSLNYNSVNLTDDWRVKIHQDFIINHYLKQFNEETIQKKQFKHCGEPCGALCKKMNGIYKKDYEPYQTLGPNSGIFDQRAAEKINHYADAMGFDAIQVGGLVSWLMECIKDKKIPKEDFDIDMEPLWDLDNFDIVQSSNHNANLGCQIIDRILNNPKCEIFRHGIRNAAKELDKKYNSDTIHSAVFTAYGEDGCMVPNQYWTPGMFSPMPIMGKYFEYYKTDCYDPYEFGKKNSKRMIYELYSDNTGICRFHRAWVEKIIDKIVNHIYDTNIDYFEHHKKLSQLINLNNKPIFWESERVVDIIKGYLEKLQLENKDDENLNKWVQKFQTDKWSTAREYWDELLRGINDGFSD